MISRRQAESHHMKSCSNTGVCHLDTVVLLALADREKGRVGLSGLR